MAKPFSDALPSFPQVRDDAADATAAFTALYDANFARIYSFIRSHVGSTSAARELVSRVFLKAYTHAHRAPAGDAAVLWLFRIARTTVIDYWRTEGRHQSASVSVDELADLIDPGVDPETQYLVKQRGTVLVHVVSLLDEDSRMLLGLKFTGQRTNREIAAILGISEAAVSMRLLRALRRLRQELVKLGVS